MEVKMKNKMMFLVLLVAVALMLSACDEDSGSATPASTPAPTAVPGDASLVELAEDTSEALAEGRSNACKVCLWADDAENCTGVCGAVSEESEGE